MAANRQSTRGLANLGKRFIGGIRSRQTVVIPPLSLSHRSVQTSAYDKNPEENVNPTIVPDHATSRQSDEYWAPHPKTGVFGPAKDDSSSGSGDVKASDGSVLEQKTFFRPMEDLDKPPVQP